MTRVEVCETADLPEGERVIVEVKGTSVGVFNVDGEYHALLNNCPHQHGPVCEGEVAERITGEYVEPGKHIDHQYTGEKMVVCPLHRWSFDIETGEHTGDADVTVPTYETVVEDGTIYLDL